MSNAADFETALARHRAGDLAGAEIAYRRILASEPGHAAARYALGLICFQFGRYQDEVAELSDAVELAPDNAAARNHLGAALVQMGEIEGEVSELRKAIALAPEFADGHYNLGKALSELRRVPEAMRCHEEAVRVEPDHAGAHFARALNWLWAGDFERGWEEYEWRWRLKQFERLDRLAQLWGGSNPSWTRRRSSDASIW